MRVFIDFTGPTLADTGGATYARNMLPRWAERAEDTVTALFSGGQIPSELATLDCTVETPPRRTSAGTGRVFDLHVALRRELLARDVDVAFFPGNFVSATMPSSVPSVVAVRSALHYHYPAQLTSARRIYRRAATYHAVRVAERIVVPSSSMADDLMRFAGAKRRKIVVVPHGVDLALFTQREESQVSKNLFLFVSKPWDYKGLDTVFRALAETDGAPDEAPRLAVADGGLTPAERADWLALAEKLKIRSRIEFVGKASHAELAHLYHQASALVLPTACESFGNVFLEAAASGCPVITSYGHGIDEAIGPVAVQVPAHRHLDIADKMTLFTQMGDSERHERSSASRAWAERFPWDKALDATRRVLSEVA